MDNINFVLLVSRWFHITAAIVAIGGGFFVRCVLMRSAKEALTDTEHQKLREAVNKRWRSIAHACIVLLLVTGVVNFFLLVLPSKVEPMPYHAIFGLKVLAALVVFFIASALTGRGTALAKMRAASRQWLTFLLILAGIIVLLSGVLGQLRASSARQEASAAIQESHRVAWAGP